jgi:hypothetical protein
MNNYTSSTMHKPQVIIISQYSNSAAYNTESHELSQTIPVYLNTRYQKDNYKRSHHSSLLTRT